MNKTMLILAGLGFAAFWACSQMVADDGPAPAKPADMEIRAMAAEFAAAFNKADAKATAAFFTDGCEYTSDTGENFRGRAALENALSDYFKANPKGQMIIDIESIRYPSKNLAIEEGTIQIKKGSELPSSTQYRSMHIREDGKWKTALTQEWGGAVDKLSDLAWLIGTWSAKAKDREMQISFEWNAKKNGIVSKYTVTEGGKVTASGTQRLMQDQRTGAVRAWSFDDAGGHGQAIWYRDGNRWVAEAHGMTPDGAETSAVNLLTRLSDNEILWRSVDRTVNGAGMPDTVPVKLSRGK